MTAMIPRLRIRWRIGAVAAALTSAVLWVLSGMLAAVPLLVLSAGVGWWFAQRFAIRSQMRAMAERARRGEAPSWRWYQYAALVIGMFVVPPLLRTFGDAAEFLGAACLAAAVSFMLLAMSLSSEFDEPSG